MLVNDDTVGLFLFRITAIDLDYLVPLASRISARFVSYKVFPNLTKSSFLVSKKTIGFYCYTDGSIELGSIEFDSSECKNKMCKPLLTQST